jgi:hypothetical protein
VRPKITVVGDGEKSASCADRLAGDDYADIVRGLAEISGSDVVILFDEGDEVFDRVRERAPNAVVVVAGDSPEQACHATLFPRSRVFGVADPEPGSVADVVEAVVLDRRKVLTCIALCEGERGIDGDFAAVPVRLGKGGIREILEDS